MEDGNAENVSVIIAEDQPDLASVYKTRLDMLGFSAVTASDGLDALSKIEHYKPKLVLLDIMMPKLSGDQVLKVMRSTVWGKDVKVLIISNLSEADAPVGLRDLGIEGYIIKANMVDDQLDRIVGTILKPVGQTEDVNALDADKQPPVV